MVTYWGNLNERFVRAFEHLNDNGYSHQLRLLFAAVARSRPDLVERSLFAEKARSTVEAEKILNLTLAELVNLKANGTLPPDTEVPHLDNYRFNHSTGKLHLGHSQYSVYFFPVGEMKE